MRSNSRNGLEYDHIVFHLPQAQTGLLLVNLARMKLACRSHVAGYLFADCSLSKLLVGAGVAEIASKLNKSVFFGGGGEWGVCAKRKALNAKSGG